MALNPLDRLSYKIYSCKVYSCRFIGVCCFIYFTSLTSVVYPQSVDSGSIQNERDLLLAIGKTTEDNAAGLKDLLIKNQHLLTLRLFEFVSQMASITYYTN